MQIFLTILAGTIYRCPKPQVWIMNASCMATCLEEIACKLSKRERAGGVGTLTKCDHLWDKGQEQKEIYSAPFQTSPAHLQPFLSSVFNRLRSSIRLHSSLEQQWKHETPFSKRDNSRPWQDTNCKFHLNLSSTTLIRNTPWLGFHLSKLTKFKKYRVDDTDTVPKSAREDGTVPTQPVKRDVRRW